MQPESVTTRADFALYIGEIAKNRKNWENNDLASFLEAFEAYVNDVDGYYLNQKIEIDANQPSWRVFADILRGATMYE